MRIPYLFFCLQKVLHKLIDGTQESLSMPSSISKFMIILKIGLVVYRVVCNNVTII